MTNIGEEAPKLKLSLILSLCLSLSPSLSCPLSLYLLCLSAHTTENHPGLGTVTGEYVWWLVFIILPTSNVSMNLQDFQYFCYTLFWHHDSPILGTFFFGGGGYEEKVMFLYLVLPCQFSVMIYFVCTFIIFHHLLPFLHLYYYYHCHSVIYDSVIHPHSYLVTLHSVPLWRICVYGLICATCTPESTSVHASGKFFSFGNLPSPFSFSWVSRLATDKDKCCM